jgi:multidrug transporter EmrE-like cation transporter
MLSNDHMALLYGTAMALIDVVQLGILKALHSGMLKNFAWMALPTLVYALQPWLFIKALDHTSMTVMNLLWDVLSDIFVTASGLFFFKEKLSFKKHLGVMFAMMATFLLGSGDGEQSIR